MTARLPKSIFRNDGNIIPVFLYYVDRRVSFRFIGDLINLLPAGSSNRFTYSCASHDKIANWQISLRQLCTLLVNRLHTAIQAEIGANLAFFEGAQDKR
jgi:hypothetical protein